ncbi:hypothetical protein BDU57DRAFT_51319 [Ampelomyces quisqualis]|uniref:XPG-I domain-containing protein n=1 Tax=Ampelomyces quisqualis TaxID=50730 RepID=A0A6A5R0B5_AMPQU|nr:hypothetical protein BDU57DRAFT_51319 [Ampelomyces quisqualis]
MGIPQLFDVIKDYEESVPIAQLAEDHQRRHGRPLRIAVDEADWRFNNVTQAQVYAIRETSDQAYQGQEKQMFYRICRFLTLNIQLIFVFDGPGRPWKNGGRGRGKIDYRARDLLKEMLRCFGIPYQEAPGEAEAECARLQMLGLVDAVWSQDSDCLMFGCTLWIRDDRVVKQKGTTDRSKENTQKSKKSARVVRASDLKAHLKIDREGLVLFAMLAGGDYDTKGLPGCGPRIAMKAVKQGLGHALCVCRSQRDCDMWSIALAECLNSNGGRGTSIPIGFPDYKTLVKYNSPKVTNDITLMNSARLSLEHTRPINELKLLEVTSSRFAIWGRLYMNWVGPVLLTRSLSTRSAMLPRETLHGIKLVREKTKKDETGIPVPVFERKLSFSPFGVTSLRREDFEGERRGYWTGQSEDLYDPDYRVEKCEMPNYWIQKVLPLDVLDPPPPEPKSRTAKRKQQSEEGGLPGSAPTRKRQHQQQVQAGEEDSPVSNKKKQRKTAKAAKDAVTSTSSTLLARQGTRPSTEHYPNLPAELIFELSDSEEEFPVSSARQILAGSARSQVSQIVDLGSPEVSEDEQFPVLRTSNEHTLQRMPSRTTRHRDDDGSISIGTEDTDLQLALRLSMWETTASTVASDISTQTIRRGSSAIFVRSPNDRARSTAFLPPTDLLARSDSSFTDFEVSKPAIRSKSFRSSPSLMDHGVLKPTPSELREIRSRRFQPPSIESHAIKSSTTARKSSAMSSRTEPSALCMPVGVTYIDLTDD